VDIRHFPLPLVIEPKVVKGSSAMEIRAASASAKLRQSRRASWGAFALPKTDNFKTLHRNVKFSKNKDEILYSNHFKEKFCLNFSLSYWLIISFQGLFLDRPHLIKNFVKYAGIVKTWEMVWSVVISKAFFIRLFVHHFFSETGLNFVTWNFITFGYCWTLQTAETFKVIREILTSWLLLKKFVATSNRLFYDLLIIFVRGRRDHHY